MAMATRNLRAALTLAVLAAMGFLAVRAGRRPAPKPAAAVAVPAAFPPVAPAPAAKPRRKAVTLAKAPLPARPERGAGLREPGEALGGTPPVRVDRSTPTTAQ